MIIARWCDRFVLASRGDACVPGVSLRLHASESAFACSNGFTSPAMYWSKYFPDPSAIRFFPKAYWRGTPVGIAGWCVHTPDAQVQCEVMSNEINQEAWFGRRYKSSLEWAPLARALGWGYDHNDMIATRYCTIDELELVEGPPPEGTF